MYEEQAPSCLPGQKRDDQRRSCRVEVERLRRSAASLVELRRTIMPSGSNCAGPSLGDNRGYCTLCVVMVNVWAQGSVAG